MYVGSVRVELHIPEARSLKDKRAVVRSLKDRLWSRYKVSVAEVDHQDLWQRAALGVAIVGRDYATVDDVLASVRSICDGEMRAVVTAFDTEIV